MVSGNSLYGLIAAGGSNAQGAIVTSQLDGSGYALTHSFAGPPTTGPVP